MNKAYTFTLNVDVWDKRQLRAAAKQRMIDEADGRKPTTAEVNELLGFASAPDIDACLVMLLDPGSLPGRKLGFSAAEADYE